eukprot:scaffold183416_cov17-Tisochrysis_lutea.AAC.1
MLAWPKLTLAQADMSLADVGFGRRWSSSACTHSQSSGTHRAEQWPCSSCTHKTVALAGQSSVPTDFLPLSVL